MTVEERAVVEVLHDKRVGNAEHERGVRARPQRQPLGIEQVQGILAQRA
jgi:hypothetical protein